MRQRGLCIFVSVNLNSAGVPKLWCVSGTQGYLWWYVSVFIKPVFKTNKTITGKNYIFTILRDAKNLVLSIYIVCIVVRVAPWVVQESTPTIEIEENLFKKRPAQN